MVWKRAGKEIKVPIVEYIEKLIKEELAKGHVLKVSVGTDSQRSGNRYKFATVILIEVRVSLGGDTMVGRGHKMIQSEFFLPATRRGKEGVLERMMTEVGKSIEIAYDLKPILDACGVKLEVHADINPNPRWESNKALNGAIGWILGMGMDFKIKPDAYAASNCGDKYANG